MHDYVQCSNVTFNATCRYNFFMVDQNYPLKGNLYNIRYEIWHKYISGIEDRFFNVWVFKCGELAYRGPWVSPPSWGWWTPSFDDQKWQLKTCRKVEENRIKFFHTLCNNETFRNVPEGSDVTCNYNKTSQ